MTRTCRQCQTAFEISAGDLAFYEKVSPVFAGHREAIPPPVFCPECRFKRQVQFRNERNLYESPCTKCGKSDISAFRPGSTALQYCRECYTTHLGNGSVPALDFDWTKSAFANFHALSRLVPQIMLLQNGRNENSRYTNYVSDNKACYLIFNAGSNEGVAYARGITRCVDSFDLLFCDGLQRSYEAINCHDSYGLLFSRNCYNCTDSAFLFNCSSCSDCLLSNNLSHKQYYVLNEYVGKERYLELKSKLSSHVNLLAAKARFETLVQSSIHRSTTNINCEDSTIDYLSHCKDCQECYEVSNAQDCRYCWFCKDCHDCQDVIGNGYGAELLYQTVGTGHGSVMCFVNYCNYSSNLYYSKDCEQCQDCFLCVGLRHKRYCILNKQYSKEEYEALVPRIIAKMREDGEWGMYFAPELSPFSYNESVAQQYFPLTREEAISQGYSWSDYVAPPPMVEKIVKASQLPDSIHEIPDTILDWAVECEVTGKPFRVIKPELRFLRENNLPFPRKHPDTRHFARVALRNPRKLFDRACAKCAKVMKTTYAPERPERVYCEECYRGDVY